jgi:hypothetical protein
VLDVYSKNMTRKYKICKRNKTHGELQLLRKRERESAPEWGESKVENESITKKSEERALSVK